jgi:hypothetical protein
VRLITGRLIEHCARLKARPDHMPKLEGVRAKAAA